MDRDGVIAMSAGNLLILIAVRPCWWRCRSGCAVGPDGGSLRLAGAGTDQPGLVGHHHRLYPVAAAQLHQDAAHMGLHGGFAEEEVPGDLPVGRARAR